MNKHGQTLVLFVLLIPVLVLFIYLVTQEAYLFYKKNEAYSVTKMIIANNIEEKSKDDIINIYKNNNIDVKSVKIIRNDNIKISITYNIPKLMFNDKYKAKLSLIGNKDGEKFIYKKG